MKQTNSISSGAVRAVAYARASAPEWARSTSAQVAAIREYAEDHGLELADEYVEQAPSNDDNRPKFQQMLQAVSQPNCGVSAVIVTHRSRFMRNAAKAREHEEALRKRGIQLISIQQEQG